MNDWKDRRITIYPEEMTVANKKRIAIRARPAQNGETPIPGELQEIEEEE